MTMKFIPPNPDKLAKGEDCPTGAGRQTITATARSVTMSAKRTALGVLGAKKARA